MKQCTPGHISSAWHEPDLPPSSLSQVPILNDYTRETLDVNEYFSMVIILILSESVSSVCSVSD